MIKTLVVGTGAMGREAMWLLHAHNAAGMEPPFLIEGFVTSNEKDHGRVIQRAPVLGDESYLFGRSDVQVLCAIGDPRIRRTVCSRLAAAGVAFATVVHPSVVMSDSVEIGAGSMISAGVVLTIDIRIGEHVILNVNASINHDAVIEDFVNVSPGVNVPGYVTLGYGSELGTNCCIVPRRRVGRGAVVGAGAVVTRDVDENTVVTGVPARVVRRLPEDQWL